MTSPWMRQLDAESVDVAGLGYYMNFKAVGASWTLENSVPNLPGFAI